MPRIARRRADNERADTLHPSASEDEVGGANITTSGSEQTTPRDRRRRGAEAINYEPQKILSTTALARRVTRR
jgi:hypothetical protein